MLSSFPLPEQQPYTCVTKVESVDPLPLSRRCCYTAISLLLVYPPPGDMALRCLHEYRGDTLVYVGEGRGGANASDEFFDGLDAEWDVKNILDLDPFPQCFERLFLLRRRQRTTVGASSQQDA